MTTSSSGSNDSPLRDLFSPERLRRSWHEADAEGEAGAGQPPPAAARAAAEPTTVSGRLAARLAQLGEEQLAARLAQLVNERAKRGLRPELLELVARLEVVLARRSAGPPPASDGGDEDEAQQPQRAALAGGAAAEAALVAAADPATLAARVGELLQMIEDLCDAQRVGSRR